MCSGNPYRRISQNKKPVLHANKTGGKPVLDRSRVGEGPIWKSFESAVQQQAKVANEDQSPGPFPTQTQGTKRKHRAAAEDWFSGYVAHKEEEASTGSQVHQSSSRLGSGSGGGDSIFADDTDLASIEQWDKKAISKLSAKDVFRSSIGNHPQSAGERDCPSLPPIANEDWVVPPAMHPERRAKYGPLDCHESAKSISSSANSPPLSHTSPPLSRRESRDGIESNSKPTGPRDQSKINGHYHKPSRWDTEAKGLDRIDTRPASGNGSVALSMDIDPESACKLGSVIVPGGQTPMTPATPVFVEPSFGNLNASHVRPQQDQLVSVLGKFAQNVTKMASLTIQRDMEQKRERKMTEEYAKSSRFHGAFRQLAQIQEQSKKSAQKATEETDQKLRKQSRVCDSLARAIVSKMMSVTNVAVGTDANGHGNNNDAETIRSLQKEVLEIKALVQEAKASAEKSKILMKENQGFCRDVQANKKEISRFHRDTASILNSYNAIKAEMELIKTPVDNSLSLNPEVEKLHQHSNELAKRIDETSESLQKLKSTIEGDDTEEGKAGLLYFTVQNEEAVDKLNKNLGVLDNDHQLFEERQNEIVARLAVLEEGRKNESVPKAVPNEVPELKDDKLLVKSTLETLKEKVTTVAAGMAALRQEQEDKDEMIGGDIDAMRNSSKAVEIELQGMRETMDSFVARIDDSISQLQNTQASMVKSISQLSQPQTNGVWSTKTEELDDIKHMLANVSQSTIRNSRELILKTQSLDDIRQSFGRLQRTLAEHQDFISGVQTAVKQLDGRFNTLTTDQLTRNMVHQMQEMYPHISHVQREIQQGIARQNALERTTRDHAATIEQLQQQNGQSGVMSTEELKKTLAADEKFGAIDTWLGRLDQKSKDMAEELTQELTKLKARVKDIEQQCPKEFANLELQIRRLNTFVDMEPSSAEQEEADVSKLGPGKRQHTSPQRYRGGLERGKKKRRNWVAFGSSDESEYKGDEGHESEDEAAAP